MLTLHPGDAPLSLRTKRMSRPKKAEAETGSFLKIWVPSFFEMDGHRVISLVPRSYHDTVLELEMIPRPSEFVRLGMIWKELDKVTETQAR